MKISPVEPVNVSLFGKVFSVDASAKDGRASWFRVGLKPNNKCVCRTRNEDEAPRRGLHIL